MTIPPNASPSGNEGRVFPAAMCNDVASKEQEVTKLPAVAKTKGSCSSCGLNRVLHDTNENGWLCGKCAAGLGLYFSKPATEKQMAYLAALGYEPRPELFIDEVSGILEVHQETKYYLWDVFETAFGKRPKETEIPHEEWDHLVRELTTDTDLRRAIMEHRGFKQGAGDFPDASRCVDEDETYYRCRDAILSHMSRWLD